MVEGTANLYFAIYRNAWVFLPVSCSPVGQVDSLSHLGDSLNVYKFPPFYPSRGSPGETGPFDQCPLECDSFVVADPGGSRYFTN